MNAPLAGAAGNSARGHGRFGSRTCSPENGSTAAAGVLKGVVAAATATGFSIAVRVGDLTAARWLWPRERRVASRRGTSATARAEATSAARPGTCGAGAVAGRCTGVGGGADATCKGGVALTIDDGNGRKRDVSSFRRIISEKNARADATVFGRFKSTGDAAAPYAIDVYSVRDVVEVPADGT